jgi:DNA-binding transcriptional LysR family regulator
MQSYPEIELDIQLSDDTVDLIEQGFDIGFRAASKQFDSSYIGKELTQFSYRICASPDYVDHHPNICRIEDLKKHNCFIYSYFRDKNSWPLGEGVDVQGKLHVNNTVFMLEAVKQGLGIGFIPDFVCLDSLARGEIIELLPKVKRPKLTLYALYPARKHVPPKLRHCIEFVHQWFAQHVNSG